MDESDQGLDNSNMTRAPLHLPTYLLYGERAGEARPDVLHVESIESRSRLHSWEIRPHRHEALFQVLFIDRGEVQATIEDHHVALRGPVVVTVPPVMPHGFAFSHDVQGDVVTMLEPHVRAVLSSEPDLLRHLLHGRCERVRRTPAGDVRGALAALRLEHRAALAWRALATDAALVRFLVAVGRAVSVATAVEGHGAATAAGAGMGMGAGASRASAHVAAFRDWIEARFREQPRMSDCAAALGITSTQLNRVCQQVLGHTAQAVLHTRLVLEAQRDLAYTSMSIKQVALDLGFSDAAYFTRFFERETGQTPSAWRTARAVASA
jgi:AraC family transcriptional activator of pobA